ncbi:MAG: dinitrogenase iron-molybdenum cofactor biosynthesis protein [Oscillospiraceae bacterium]|nr:dinitrogenase iron-molybdenum cofactor biosynthesis protein [Oscillospiraceae bacterium]
MKIAVTYENGEIFQHFGHCETFEIFTVEDGAIQKSEVVSSAGQGHGALATFLAEQDVRVVICGGIGGGAKAALAAARIMVFGGVTGNTRDAVEAYITGSLEFDPNANCSHHDHGGHTCGGCGKHGCGGHGCH